METTFRNKMGKHPWTPGEQNGRLNSVRYPVRPLAGPDNPEPTSTRSSKTGKSILINRIFDGRLGVEKDC